MSSDITRSDSNHPRLFIESKYRERHAVRTLYDGTKALAKKEGKAPVLALFDKGRSGFLLCIHGDDFPTVAAEFSLASPELFAQAVRRVRPELSAFPAPDADHAVA